MPRTDHRHRRDLCNVDIFSVIKSKALPSRQFSLWEAGGKCHLGFGRASSISSLEMCVAHRVMQEEGHIMSMLLSESLTGNGDSET